MLREKKNCILCGGGLMLLCSIAFRFVFKELDQTKKQALQEQCNG